jgi:hypothetical protein
MTKRSKFTRPAWLGEQGEGGQSTADKPRLTTSAMIASLAGPNQRTKPAPFGNALARLADTRPEIAGLFVAGILPGLLMAGGFVATCWWIAKRCGYKASYRRQVCPTAVTRACTRPMAAEIGWNCDFALAPM